MFARTVLAELTTAPVKILAIGGIGTGKSAFLTEARNILQENGFTVSSTPPGHRGRPADAMVIDDVHLLGSAELDRLTQLAAEPDGTLVLAGEARTHNADLRALTMTIERHRRAIRLGPVPSKDLTPEMMDATAGIPFLVSAVRSSDDRNPAAFSRAAYCTLVDRLRSLDDSTLDALMICSLSADLGATDLAAVLAVSTDTARDLIDGVRGTGLIEPSHSPQFVSSVHQAAAQIVGTARHHELETTLLNTQLAMATLSAGLALRLAEHGVRHEQLAQTLSLHVRATRTDLAGIARLCRAAVDAGATDMRVPLADALALSGDCSAARAHADTLLAATDPNERSTGVRVTASIAAHDGNLAQAAELFGWLGPQPNASVNTAAAVVFAGTGDLAAARTALETPDEDPPTTAVIASKNLADGLLRTLECGYPDATGPLGQALAAEYPAHQATPDSPAAVVTLAALHGGDPVRARSVLTRAVRQSYGPLFDDRHRLLLAWVKMHEGQLAAASADIGALGGQHVRDLHRRDALWMAALRTAIARRSGDLGGVQTHWQAALDVLAEYSVDLFSLLPLGELWIAAGRIDRPERLAPYLDRAFALLGRLGNPPSWSVPLHWAGVHAGIQANDPAAVTPHGQALASAAAHSPFAKALAGAGRTWLRVLANQVDPNEVGVAARALTQFGLTSDATRLAGQAALTTSDSKASASMLQLARDLKLTVPDTVAAELDGAAIESRTGPAIRPSVPAPPQRSTLSDREREVAELLVLGMPYRDIGSQLFISAKTVEHHVARIRRRLGAESRPAMLSMLRAVLTQDEGNEHLPRASAPKMPG